jgi:hypothetical protein
MSAAPTRRTALSWGFAAAAAVATPALADLELDGPGRLYRRYALLVVGPRDDATGLVLTRAVVDILARFQDTSRAQVARAATTQRAGLLIGTDQRDLAVMSRPSAEALFRARPPFDNLDDVPLRTLVSFGSHLLVCRTDFLDRHAYLVAKTVSEHPDALPEAPRRPESAVPIHQGAAAYFTGQVMPA